MNKMKAVRQARDALGERGNPGGSGSGPGPPQAGPSIFPAPRAPVPRTQGILVDVAQATGFKLYRTSAAFLTWTKTLSFPHVAI